MTELNSRAAGRLVDEHAQVLAALPAEVREALIRRLQG
jgi:hypothetical protein